MSLHVGKLVRRVSCIVEDAGLANEVKGAKIDRLGREGAIREGSANQERYTKSRERD